VLIVGKTLETFICRPLVDERFNAPVDTLRLTGAVKVVVPKREAVDTEVAERAPVIVVVLAVRGPVVRGPVVVEPLLKSSPALLTFVHGIDPSGVVKSP
jgi:hypothetical protein